MADKGATKQAKARDRSPNYPALTFEVALEATKKLWEAEKKHPMGLDLALKRLGYTKNGRSMQVISALKKYGLIASEGDDIRVSDDANAVFIFPAGSSERESRIKTMAMQPSVFREVLKRFPGGLPSDENLSAKLQHEMGFTAEGVGAFIKALRSAVAIAGVDLPPGPADTVPQDISLKAKPMPQPAAVSVAPPTTPQRGVQPRFWDLGDDTVMQVTIPPRLTKKNVEKLRRYVEVLASEAAIAWEDESTN